MENDIGTGTTFGLLGPVLVAVGGVDRTPTRARLRDLLALLLVRANTAVSSGSLIEELYGRTPPPSAVTALQVHVSQLRKVLEPGCPRAEQRLRTVPGGYQLRVAPGELDLFRFEAAAAEGTLLAATGDAAGAGAVLRRALGEWRGPALAGAAAPVLAEVFAPWADERRLQVLRHRVAADLAAGRSAALVPELRNLVAQHPLDEQLCELLVLALYRAGRQADSLAAYEDFRTVLRAELGCAPCAQLQKLHRRILDSDPDLQCRRAAAQVEPRVVPAQLPGCASRLVGRAEQTVALLAALADPAGRPRCLVRGGPGTGTTALALSVAHTVSDRYPDGQLHARIGDRTSPDDVVAGFLRALGHDAADPAGTRAAALHRELATRRLLVVVDDVPAGWDLTALHDLPEGCALIVTSADALPPLRATCRVSTGPLSELDALRLLSATLGLPRVRDELAAACDVVRLCGRLPLAVRVVAARVAGRPHWTLRSVARRLAAPGALLGELVAGDLHVEESLMRGYARCGEGQRAAFRDLGRTAAPGPAGEDTPVVAGRHLDAAAAAGLAEGGLLVAPAGGPGDPGYALSPLCAALVVALHHSGRHSGRG